MSRLVRKRFAGFVYMIICPFLSIHLPLSYCFTQKNKNHEKQAIEKSRMYDRADVRFMSDFLYE